MRIAVEAPLAEDGRLREAEDGLAGAVTGGLRGRGQELVEGHAPHPGAREHAPRREGGHDVGYGDEGMTTVTVGEVLLVGRFDAVVELVGHAVAQLLGQRVDVDAAQRHRREEGPQPPRHPRGRPRSRRRPRGIGPSRRRRSRRPAWPGAPARSRRPPPVPDPSSRRARRRSAPSSSRTTPSASVGDIGGALAWSCASASRASSGRPSTTNDSICPSFMTAPFMWPSSRATSSAERTAKRSSSSARRSRCVTMRRRRVTARSIPRRTARAARRTRRRTPDTGRREPSVTLPIRGA